MNSRQEPLRVLFCCSSVGVTNRGIESFFREAFDNLRETPGLEIQLAKGGGVSTEDERVVWCLRKTSSAAKLIGQLTGRSSYAVEQWTSFLPIVQVIRRFDPHVIFSSDANLFFLLRRFRNRFGGNWTLLFSNGGPCHPPFNRTDCVHQVAPMYLEEALAAGESSARHFLVPYGINVPAGAPVCDPAEKRAIRERLGLPLDRKIILSVGWIAAQHKRMDYVVEEVARIPGSRPFLQLLGAMDDKSRQIIDSGNRLLGASGFSARSVPYEEVCDYYRAADCFVLASLAEGFGRVYLEALLHGLPVLAHRHAVIEFVVGAEGNLGNLSQPGELAGMLTRELQRPLDPGSMQRRRESVRDRFSWPVLAAKYSAMFRACVESRLNGP